MANVIELGELRKKAMTDARSLVDVAEKAKRPLNEDEERQYGAFMDDVKRFGKEIEREGELVEEERKFAEDSLKALKGKEKQGTEVDATTVAFRKMILEGERSLSNIELNSLKTGLVESRGLTAGTDIKGGFTLTPQEFIAQLIVNVKNKVFMRQLATVIPLNGSSSCGVPTLDTDVGDADWTPEVKTVAEDDSIAFGKRELKPHPLSKLVKVSEPLLRNSALPIEGIVNDRMAYKFAVPMEKAYLTGDGNGKPLGVFTASNDGIPTSRDVSTDNSTTSMTADGLINAKYSLKSQYMTTASWLFHRDAIKQIAKLKTGDGYYIFELADKPGIPDMLLGRPMIMSEYAPNTFTTGLYVGMFADFSWYWIADSLALQIRRLNELYALTNQIGIIGRMESDGMPVLAEAFARVQLA